MVNFEQIYLKIITEANTLVKNGKINKNSILETNKENIENPLYGKTYNELEKIAKNISRNIHTYDAGDRVECPICGEKLIKNTHSQWGHTNNKLNHTTTDGKLLKVRDCSMKWTDALKALNKQYPDDNGEAVQHLKNLAK